VHELRIHNSRISAEFARYKGMFRRPPEPFVSASRQGRRESGRALLALLVGLGGVVTAAWFLALGLLVLWLISLIF
jgi:hypothetical protein